MSDHRKVIQTPEQILKDFRDEFPSAPNFSKKLVPALSPLADRLIHKSCIVKKDAVKVDHLAFSFPLSSLRHCHRAGFAGTTAKKQHIFPLPPKIKDIESKKIDELELHRLQVSNQLSEFYTKTLKVFIEHVLGFYIEVPRGKGFHGYTDSLTMRTETGIEVGFVGMGGQNDTAYIQISGTGCKYLFSQTTPFVLHHRLNTVLSINFLSRIDLAKDDYDNVFNCEYAATAYKDGIFRTGKGGRMPVIKLCDEFIFDENGGRVFDVEMVCVGKRTSPVFWRVYNKKLEQKIDDDRLSWYRSEVELKKWSVDALLNADLAFAGINGFSQSLSTVEGVRTKSMNKTKEACLSLVSRVRWYRHAAGRALNDVLELVNGDISKAFGLLLPDKFINETLGIPPTHKELLNHVLEC